MRFITLISLILFSLISNASNSYVDQVPIINIANILLQEPNEQSLRETCDYYNLRPSNQKIALKGIPSDNLLVFERDGEKIVVKPETMDGRPVFQIHILGLKNDGKVNQMLEALGYKKQSLAIYSSGRKRCENQRDYIKFYLVEVQENF